MIRYLERINPQCLGMSELYLCIANYLGMPLPSLHRVVNCILIKHFNAPHCINYDHSYIPGAAQSVVE